MWTQPSHHRYWSMLRKLGGRPGLDFYELRHVAAKMLLERAVTPWDVAPGPTPLSVTMKRAV